MKDFSRTWCEHSLLRWAIRSMGLFFTSSNLLYVDKIIRWRNRSERSPCMRKVGCSNPSRDRPKSLKTWRKRSATMPASRALGVDHYKRISRVTVGKPSLLYGHECRVHVKICSPSLAMVASPYKWKIFEWDENPQKQTKKSYHSF